MRIPRHHNQAPVAYLHQTNNNDIVSRNTLPDTLQTTATLNTTTTNPLSSSLLASSISTAAITENSTITNYTPNFENFNGNGNGNGNGDDNTIESTTNVTTGKRTISPNSGRLIDRDDNVNLMLAPVTNPITNTTNCNHNQALKFSRNQNYSRYQDHELLNQNCQNLNRNRQNFNQHSEKDCDADTRATQEVHYNNLNQLNNRGCGYDPKTEATRIEVLIGNNGNNNEFNDGSRVTSSQQIFEGNLNVLVAEEGNVQIIHQIIGPASFKSGKLSSNNFNSRFASSGLTNARTTAESEDEEENLNTAEDKHIVTFKGKIQNDSYLELNSNENDEVVDEVDFRGNESEDEDIGLNTTDNKVNNVNANSKSVENFNISECHSNEIENSEYVSSPSDAVEFLSSETNTKNTAESLGQTTGAPNIPNRNLNSNRTQLDDKFIDKDTNPNILSAEFARRNLEKLDLDKNLKEQESNESSCASEANKDNRFSSHLSEPHLQQEEVEHQQQIQSQEYHENLSNYRHHSSHQHHHHHHRHSYQRQQDNSLSSNSTESSPDDSLLDDEDGFSLTPSSCASLYSPEIGHYPRGIINPNYPGFQHLAHTLSEHFVNHHLDQDDSDLSEFEVELSVESLDDSFGSYRHNSEMAESPAYPSNADTDENQKESQENDSSRSLELCDQANNDTNENVADGKDVILPDIQVVDSETNHPGTPTDTITKSNCTQIKEMANTESILSIYSDELSCDLDTYLKKFETITDIKTLQSPSLIEDATRNCPTPDILIKNDKKSCRKKNSPTLSAENRPDLLRNVSPNSDCCYSSDEKKPRICVPDTIPIEAKSNDRVDKQDDLTSYSITPVDIIGDFGREVEHEFGLIVSGYNSSLIGRSSMCDEDSIARALNSTYEKMTDAALSECKEAISVGSDLALSSGKSRMHTTSTYDCTTCDLVKTTTPSSSSLKDETLECPFENVSSSCKQSEFEHFSLPHSPSSSARSSMQNSSDQPNGDQSAQPPSQSSSIVGLANENSIENSISDGPTETATLATPTRSAVPEPNPEAGTISAGGHGITSFPAASANNAEKLIPTAIVKPKYQKSSYDERQLPPIGLAYCVDTSPRAWFEQKSAKDSHPASGTASHVTNPNPLSKSSGDSLRVRKIQNLSGPSDHQRDHRDRTVKYSKKSIGRALSSAVNSRSEKLTHNGSVRKDLSSSAGSCIAIVTPRKKDKMENYTSFSGGISGEKRVLCNSVDRNVVFEKNNNNNNNILKSKKMSINNNRKERSANTASFDVYNIETALPVIDLEAIENHLKKAKEEERKRRNDREEIRRRLAMGAEDDYFSKMVNQDRPGRKPSLQSRLQSGMNLQICFMNEASSDTESPSSDSETCPKLSKSISNSSNMSRYSNLSTASSAAQNPYNSRPLSVNIHNTNNINSTITNTNNNNNITNMFTNKTNPNNNSHNIVFNNKKINNQINNRPSTLSLGPPINDDHDTDVDFFTKQARLQIEARMALAQAKDMAHMQMEIERQKQKISPITEVIRNSMEKVGVPFPPEKRRVSRQMLTDMNIAQLQIIVNDLHSQIERLNEQLVQYLMERDDLHMSQDSMLVDIEDLTRYLGAKEQSKLNGKSSSVSASNETPTDYNNQNHQNSITANNINNSTTTTTTTQNGGVQSQSKFLRIANLVKK